MNVDEIMTKSVKGCGPDDSLDTAARTMWENDCGCVPVIDEQGRPVAMLTDRDVCMAAYTQGRMLRDTVVRSAMSGSLHTVSPGDPIDKAERMMQEHQVRRLPVVEADGRIVGLVSLNDISRESARERPQKHRAVSADGVAFTLAAVCRPRVCPISAAPSDTTPTSQSLVAAS
jgi:CBS domain-containing protein